MIRMGPIELAMVVLGSLLLYDAIVVSGQALWVGWLGGILVAGAEAIHLGRRARRRCPCRT